jgi:ABC-2 type transport system ATP-binding protein
VAVLISTPYMDEAARCHRVGFMRHGKLIAEDSPSKLRARLEGRILELRGSPSRLLRRLAEADTAVETVRAFGDRLHLRLAEKATDRMTHRLSKELASGGGKVHQLRLIPPDLEDVFIYLSEQAYE